MSHTLTARDSALELYRLVTGLLTDHYDYDDILDKLKASMYGMPGVVRGEVRLLDEFANEMFRCTKAADVLLGGVTPKATSINDIPKSINRLRHLLEDGTVKKYLRTTDFGAAAFDSGGDEAETSIRHTLHQVLLSCLERNHRDRQLPGSLLWDFSELATIATTVLKTTCADDVMYHMLEHLHTLQSAADFNTEMSWAEMMSVCPDGQSLAHLGVPASQRGAARLLAADIHAREFAHDLAEREEDSDMEEGPYPEEVAETEELAEMAETMGTMDISGERGEGSQTDFDVVMTFD